jgi:hypothetical protein
MNAGMQAFNGRSKRRCPGWIIAKNIERQAFRCTRTDTWEPAEFFDESFYRTGNYTHKRLDFYDL